jgi:coenzyme F420 hydrogenase subunit beta
MKLKAAQEYARPECHHCGDFSGELADISCGGVGAMDWTITIVRTPRGEELFNRMVAEGLFEIRPIEEFENSMKVLLRLTNKQHLRVPISPGQDASRVRAV